jgi:hypothetical protein
VFGAGYPSLPTMTVQEFYEQRIKDGEWVHTWVLILFDKHHVIPGMWVVSWVGCINVAYEPTGTVRWKLSDELMTLCITKCHYYFTYLQNNCIGCSVRKEEIILWLLSGENLNDITTTPVCWCGGWLLH